MQLKTKNLRCLLFVSTVLLFTNNVFSKEANSNTKISASLTEPKPSGRSSSPTYGYVFHQYRKPRYSYKSHGSLSTYNGHPHFSYGKATTYHTAPSVSTYDAGIGSYAPSYDSVGGYGHYIHEDVKHEYKPDKYEDVKHEYKPDKYENIKHEYKPDKYEDVKHEYKPDKYENIKHEYKPDKFENEDVKHEYKPDKYEHEDYKPSENTPHHESDYEHKECSYKHKEQYPVPTDYKEYKQPKGETHYKYTVTTKYGDQHTKPDHHHHHHESVASGSYSGEGEEEEETDYKSHDKPKAQVHITYNPHAPNYGCAKKDCGESYKGEQNSGHYVDIKHTNQHYEKDYPETRYEGGHFAYSIYTDHGRPVYSKPVKHYSNSHHMSNHQGYYKPVTYGWHYSIKPGYNHQSKYPSQSEDSAEKHPVTSNKYPVETYSQSSAKYPTKYVTSYHHSEYTQKPSYHKIKPSPAPPAAKYPSDDDDHEEEKNVKLSYHSYDEHTENKYNQHDDNHKSQNGNYKEPNYPKTQHSSSHNEHNGHYSTDYSISHKTPYSSYSMQVHVPWASFRCKDHYHPGFYADVESDCKIWHYCQPDGRQDSFKCPKDTVFNQKTLICDWWFNVDCPSSARFFHVNQELYKLIGQSHSQSEQFHKDKRDGKGKQSRKAKPKTKVRISSTTEKIITRKSKKN